jgi:hypothetical protein
LRFAASLAISVTVEKSMSRTSGRGGDTRLPLADRLSADAQLLCQGLLAQTRPVAALFFFPEPGKCGILLSLKNRSEQR